MPVFTEMDNPLYNKQFILGPHWIETLPSLKQLKVSRPFYLTVHPDLNTYQAHNGNRSITFLGSIFDPRKAHRSYYFERY